MRVHNQIRSPACFRKRHVFFVDNQSTYTFLTVSARKLISQLWSSHFPSNSLYDCILIVGSQNYSIYMIFIAIALENTRLVVPSQVLLYFIEKFLIIASHYYWYLFVYKYLSAQNIVTYLG